MTGTYIVMNCVCCSETRHITSASYCEQVRPKVRTELSAECELVWSYVSFYGDIKFSEWRAVA